MRKLAIAVAVAAIAEKKSDSVDSTAILDNQPFVASPIEGES